MRQLLKEEKLKIQNLTEKFGNKTLGNDSPKQMCFTICYPLSLHLKNNGIENLIKAGSVNNGEPHYLLIHNDNEEIIIDPTIKQFDVNQPTVFIGKKPNNYGEFTTFKFDDIYEIWLYPLLNDGWTKPLSKYVKIPQQLFDTKSLLKINIKAATILYDETKNEPSYSEMSKKYFEAIDQMVIKYSDKIEKLIDPSLLNEFNSLLFKAKN